MDPKRQKIILAALGVVLVGVWGSVFLGRPARRGGFSGTPPAVSPPAALPAKGAAASSGEEGWGENPFRGDRAGRTVSAPAVTLPGSPEGYILNGILWDETAPSAVVNGRLVAVGDELDGWKVAEIRKDRVVLSNGTTTQTLK